MNNVVIVIPARGGSKGIPNKNIYQLNGKPLLAYTIEAAIGSNLGYPIAVSTDSDNIAMVARDYKDVIVIPRPAAISGDTASTEDALLHAIDYLYENLHITCEYIMTLQPTSPLRKSETIKDFCSVFFETNNYDAQLTLNATYTDFWVCDGSNYRRLYENASRRRQERKPLYVENSCIYITKCDSLRETKSVLGHRVNGYIINDVEATDINEYIDLDYAEVLLERKSDNNQ